MPGITTQLRDASEIGADIHGLERTSSRYRKFLEPWDNL